MAQIDNPRKNFQWSIAIAPFPMNPWLAQKVNIPDISIDIVEHGDTNHDIKTGGRVKFTPIQIDKIMTTDGSDNYFFDWAASVQDSLIGGGLPPQQYKRTVTITELAEDGQTIINTWIGTGCWPSKINGIDLDRQGSDNTIESVELCVDKLEKV